jgi:hypothetical protein
MKKTLVLLVSMFLVTSTAYAKVCPKLWAQFDADVKTTKAKADDVKKAKKLRADGEKLHNDKTHDKSEAALREALKLIGSKATN